MRCIKPRFVKQFVIYGVFLPRGLKGMTGKLGASSENSLSDLTKWFTCSIMYFGMTEENKATCSVQVTWLHETAINFST
jgi:hypothetical protein